MDYILATVLVVSIIVVFDKVVLWLEKQGWLNYQQTEKCNGKSVFSELSDYMQPKVCPAECSENKTETKKERPTRYFLE